MTVEEIARVVDDVRTGNYRLTGDPTGPEAARAKAILAASATRAPIVDITAIHDAYRERDESSMLYEDHQCVAPPWDTGLFAYTNVYGNVYVMLYEAFRADDPDVAMPRWEDDKGLDWDTDVHWSIDIRVFLGGKSGSGSRIATTGPVYQFQWALGPDGEPLDLHWVVLHEALYEGLKNETASDHPMTIPMTVLLDALQFLNCRNIEIVEPRRPNHVRKRLAKAGVTINEIHVFPTGKSSRSGVRGDPIGSVHAPVRGHFAEYGPRYGKGLLFGKYEGRFYVSPHVRGSKDVGESVQSFTLRPEAN